MLVVFSCLYSSSASQVAWIIKKYMIKSQDFACHVTLGNALKSLWPAVCSSIKWEIIIVHLNRPPSTKSQRPKGYVKNNFFTCIAPMLCSVTEWFHQWRVYEALRQQDSIFIHTQLLYMGRRNQVFLLSLRIKSQWKSRQRCNQAVFGGFFEPDFASSSGTCPRLFYSQRPLVTASSWPFPSHHSCLLEGPLWSQYCSQAQAG